VVERVKKMPSAAPMAICLFLSESDSSIGIGMQRGVISFDFRKEREGAEGSWLFEFCRARH
jgi:hypothetical protein